MSTIRELKDGEFKKDVLESTLPVLVDFFAPWCGPCRMLAPVLDEKAKHFEGRLSIVKVNIDDLPELAEEYGIQSVPTMILFKRGKIIDTVVGFPSSAVLQGKLEAVANASLNFGVCGCSA